MPSIPKSKPTPPTPAKPPTLKRPSLPPRFPTADKDIRAPLESAEGRVLVLCFDGTANEFDDTNTNVAKLFSFLEKSSPKQLVYYQTGIGTYIGPGITSPIFKWLAKTADQGIALFLDQHIIGGYRFLQENWKPGDRICLFGFSRGAYTARALAGMLYTVGLLPKGMPEQVDFAYSIYKKGIRSTAYKRAFARTVTIEFIGVWDTVSSVGAIIPRVLPFSSDNHITKTFRHAVSLDEHRAKFRSNTWHLTVDPEHEDKENMPEAGILRTLWGKLKRFEEEITRTDEEDVVDVEREELDREGGLFDRPPTDVREVWFSGCHCDVGGGNAKDSERYALSNVPLRWMLKEIIAADTGIMFRKGEMHRHRISYIKLVEEANVARAERMEREKAMSHRDEDANAIRMGLDHNEFSTETSREQFKSAKEAMTNLGHPERKDASTGATLIPENVNPDSKIHITLENTDADASIEIKGKKSADGGTTDDEDGEVEPDVIPKAPAYKLPKHERQRYKDAVSPITDELTRQPVWWLLELLPFISSHQDEHGHWRNYLRMNVFRKRDIPMPPAHSNPNSVHNESHLGVNLPSNTLFHVSVKERMESEECKYATWKTLWRKKTESYRPRAWPSHGEPLFVE
ncbi:uncharacterized protein EI90DRAFT_3286815 [Cantharellus anzutake]|uniref:uncharacterized protein n=1 Tax=Cantharellus anzutake TaxID=1750568 RepID=UPI001905FC32|nr:uncharacterized protein EI90DRAFT_3286815 [Cantharellus anzutake]KAF8338079.1 hypothetical protein EI90DRAFT_3286815 [Cantharellus anzutake]